MKKYELIQVQDNEISLLPEALEKFRKLQMIKVQAEIMEKEFKQELMEAMEEHGIKKIKFDMFNATYIAPTESTRFNSSKFKKEHAELFEEYQIKTKRKGYVKVEFND
jgi:hypothetical protein